MSEPIRVLFVCMGNICRSPAAEAVFDKIVEDRGLSDRFEIDSAGTLGYHAGERPDPRMRRAGEARGYHFVTCARKFMRVDFDRFDRILVMDQDNLAEVRALSSRRGHLEKVRLMCDYHPDPGVTAVPDPYYGGPEGFERVLDILEVACTNLLEEILEGVPG